MSTTSKGRIEPTMKRRFALGLSSLALMAMFAIVGIGTASAHPASNTANEPVNGDLRVHVTADVNRVCISHRNPTCVTETGTFNGTFFLDHFDTYKGSLVAVVNMDGVITYKDGSTENFGRAERMARVDSITLMPGDKPGVLGDLRLTFNSAYLMHQLQHDQDTEELGFFHVTFSVMSIEESRYVNPNRLNDVFTAPQVAGQALALNELLGFGDIS